MDYLQSGERLTSKNALIMLNIILKSGQNKMGKCDVFGGPVKMKRAWKQIARKQNKVCHAAHLIIYGLDEPPMVDENYLAKATERVSRITVIFTCPG